MRQPIGVVACQMKRQPNVRNGPSARIRLVNVQITIRKPVCWKTTRPNSETCPRTQRIGPRNRLKNILNPNTIFEQRIMNCCLTELIVQPNIPINPRLLEDPSQQGDADFLAVRVRYREASLILDHIEMLAAPERPGKPDFLQSFTSSRCETGCGAVTKPPLRRSS